MVQLGLLQFAKSCENDVEWSLRQQFSFSLLEWLHLVAKIQLITAPNLWSSQIFNSERSSLQNY
jgi:hypothetical protein